MSGGMFKVLLLVVVVFVFAVAGVSFFSSSRLPNATGGTTQVSVSEAASQEFDQKIQGFLGQTQSFNNEQIRKVAISQEEVTSKIADMAKNGENPFPLIKDIQVNLQNNKIFAAGNLDVSGLISRVSVVATVQNTDGKPELKLEDADFGQLPVPQEVKDQVYNAIASINLLSGSIPINLRSIKVENGQLILEGSVR